MTKLEKLIEGIQKLKSPQNEKRINGLIEGIQKIAAEYRRRKANEKALQEAAGFKKLDQYRAESGLSNKEFIENVGKTIIESSHTDEVKGKLMEALGKYAFSLNEPHDCPPVRWGFGALNEDDLDLLANKDFAGFKQRVLKRTHVGTTKDDDLAREDILAMVKDQNGDVNGTEFKVARMLEDTPTEKLILLEPTGKTVPGATVSPIPSFMYLETRTANG